VTPYRILSLDGGGIRGLFSLVLLGRLQRECPGRLDKAALLAGASNGRPMAADQRSQIEAPPELGANSWQSTLSGLVPI
jgi:patatin-like phospholipase/acyl hydrolase